MRKVGTLVYGVSIEGGYFFDDDNVGGGGGMSSGTGVQLSSFLELWRECGWVGNDNEMNV